MEILGSWHIPCTEYLTCGLYHSGSLGHNFSSATCTSGSSCTRCGMYNGGALGHSYGANFSHNSSTHYKECSRCHAKTAVSSHTYKGIGVCVTCGR